MEPPSGILASLWQFILFIPCFTGFLLLGVIKGIVFCPHICLIAAFWKLCYHLRTSTSTRILDPTFVEKPRKAEDKK